MTLSSSTRGLLLGLMAVMATSLAAVLPWVSDQVGQRADTNSCLKALSFRSLRDPSLVWTSFDHAVAFQGEIFFVDVSTSPNVIRAVQLSTGRVRYVDVAPPQPMLLVHQDRVQILSAPPIATDMSSKQHWPLWGYIGPFVFRDRPTILKGPPWGSIVFFIGPPNYEILSHDGTSWVSVGTVPLPKTFVEWQSQITRVLDDGPRLWVVVRSGLNNRLYCRCGLGPTEEDDRYASAVAQQQFYPESSDGALEAISDDAVSALAPDNLIESLDQWDEQPVSANNPENVEPLPRSPDWNERRRIEAMAQNQPASAIDPENACDWQNWYEVFDSSQMLTRALLEAVGEPEGPRVVDLPAALLAYEEKMFIGRMPFPTSQWSTVALANGFPTVLGWMAYLWVQGVEHHTVQLPQGVTEHESFRRESNAMQSDPFQVGILRPTPQTVALSATDGTYLVTSRRDGYIQFRRLTGGRIDYLTSLPGPLPRRILVELSWLFFCTIVLPTLVFCGCAVMVIRGHHHAMGNHRLAATWRRGAAKWLDLLLIVSPVALPLFIHRDFALWLDHARYQVNLGIPPWASFATLTPSTLFGSLRQIHQHFVAVILAIPVSKWMWVASATIMVAMVLGQAIWGVTPGKWTCGIKVVRSTGRRCGLIRSLARELVFFAETLCGLVWIPMLAGTFHSPRRRRFGDWVADTIVIDAKHSRGAS